ncbi:MAG TPA: hypothetical protein VNS57_12380 [Steroidobacteraceae bacterium]|nr:hypothetical protein [Steroidobacteraceae bacterium]
MRANSCRLWILALLSGLLSACGGGGGGGGGSPDPGTPPANVTVSGRITFERVPFQTPTSLDAGAGLNYAATFEAPARAVVVELLNSTSQAVLATTTTDDNGSYTFTTTPNTGVIVRAKAQTRRSAPSWDIRVRNNANGNALYVLDSTAFNTGTANVTRNLLATTGWADFGGTNYVGPRAAAPFAILDTLYAAVQFVLTNGNASQNLPVLDVFWSPANNNAAVTFNPTVGNIQSTAFRTGDLDYPDGIYVLGQEGNDTDEFDQHVIAHEFQHFLEVAISRAESPGGPHSLGDRSDLRLAFSEGFANAFSAMVLNDPIYKDSLGTSQGSRFNFNLEDNTASPEGWFNEDSIGIVAWDLYDAANDSPDAVSLGYGPIFEVLAEQVRTTPALVSVYPFLSALKARPGAPVAAIDALAQSQSIFGTDPYGTGETNAGSVTDALPIYTPLTVNGGAVAVCGTTTAGTYNAIGNRRFLRFSLAAARTVTINVAYTATGSMTGGPDPDPDLVLYRNGFLGYSEETGPSETLTGALEAGDYVIEVYEFSHVDSEATERRGRTCMDVTVAG